MAYTRHGHHIPGTDLEEDRVLVARCGGPRLCGRCGDDALTYYGKDGTEDHFQCCSVPKQKTVAAQLQELTATQETMYKVYDALRSAGLTRQQALNAINEMQNAGIYFREAKDD